MSSRISSRQTSIDLYSRGMKLLKILQPFIIKTRLLNFHSLNLYGENEIAAHVYILLFFLLL